MLSFPKDYFKPKIRFGANSMTPKRIPSIHNYPFYKEQQDFIDSISDK